MSFDPFGQPPGSQPPPSPPNAPPGIPPGSPQPVPPGAMGSPARERVMLPGMFLIAVGALNSLVGLWCCFELVVALATPADRMHEAVMERTQAMGQMFPTLKKQLEDEMQNKTPDDIKRQALTTNAALAAFFLIPALLVVLGGVQMIRLRSFGLCIFASVVAAIPCLSPASCCALGLVAGIWSLMVLLMPEVRSSFQ